MSICKVLEKTKTAGNFVSALGLLNSCHNIVASVSANYRELFCQFTEALLVLALTRLVKPFTCRTYTVSISQTLTCCIYMYVPKTKGRFSALMTLTHQESRFRFQNNHPLFEMMLRHNPRKRCLRSNICTKNCLFYIAKGSGLKFFLYFPRYLNCVWV